MECLFGIQGKDFVLIASDTTCGRSIVKMKSDYDKMYKLNDKLVMAVCGETGDAIQFAEFIEKNIKLYKMRNGYELSPHAASHFIRKNLADSLRTRSAYAVNLLIAGFDEKEGPSLYYMDYLGSAVPVPTAVHGYGAHFTYGLLDRMYKEDLTQDDAVELLQMCLDEMARRFIVSLPSFKVRIISKEGTRDLPSMSPKVATPVQ